MNQVSTGWRARFGGGPHRPKGRAPGAGDQTADSRRQRAQSIERPDRRGSHGRTKPHDGLIHPRCKIRRFEPPCFGSAPLDQRKRQSLHVRVLFDRGHMGDSSAPRRPMAWQNTLGEMKAHGTRLAQTVSCKCTDRWIDLDVDELIANWGAGWIAWDRRPPCKTCGTPGHYMASPGPSTPYRPLRSSSVHPGVRRAFLIGFGFSKRDIVRIKAMAEATTANSIPKALKDLDVAFRIGACWPGSERHSSGLVLGEWLGRTLLYWEMLGAERDRWARRRRGPRPV